MDRRRFLKLSGAGLAGAALLLSVGAVDGIAQSTSGLEAEFAEAASKDRVPKELLSAISYVNTRWEMPPTEASDYEEGSPEGKGTFGIMALVQNPTADTLGEAAKLTGFFTGKLKTDHRSNILGDSALLAKSQGEKPATLGEWFGAVDGKGGSGKLYDAVAGIGGGNLFASRSSQRSRAVLRQGSRAANGSRCLPRTYRP